MILKKHFPRKEERGGEKKKKEKKKKRIRVHVEEEEEVRRELHVRKFPRAEYHFHDSNGWEWGESWPGDPVYSRGLNERH